MAKRYQMTARRRAALRKAQIASARKRSRNKKIKRAAIVGGVAVGLAGVAVARHKLSGSGFVVSNRKSTVIHGERIKTTRGTRLDNPKGTLRGKQRFGPPSRSVVSAPGRSRKLGKTGTFNGALPGGGRSTGYQRVGKRKTLTVSYVHRPLKSTQVTGKLGSTISGTKVGNRLAYKTRALRKKQNPYAAVYNQKTLLNYGSYGKRLPTANVIGKSRGGKQVII